MTEPRPNAVEQAVLAANEAFYAAFEAADIDAISAVWERDERAVCTHPGWGTLRGWDAIRGSFEAILRNGAPGQFIVTSVEVDVRGDVAWVTCDENLWSDAAVGTVAACNVLVRDPLDGRWRFAVHHGSAVHATPPTA